MITHPLSDVSSSITSPTTPKMTVPAFATSVPLIRVSPSIPLSSLRPRPEATVTIRYNTPDHSIRLPLRALSSPTPILPNPIAAATAPQDAEHRLTAAVRARTVVSVCTSATLCTASKKHEGIPFGSHVDFVLDPNGCPVFLLANNAMHTKNLKGEPRCSLYCQPPSTFGQDGCRTTLVGDIVPLEEHQLLDIRENYVHTHAHASDALKFPDLFAFYRMNIRDVFFVGGYGVISQWVDVAGFVQADPDPLAHDSAEIVAHINNDKKDDLTRLCKIFLACPDVDSCKMTALDRLGFDLRIRDSVGAIREYRVAFRETVSNRFDVQSALVKTFQEAWERENGYDETWEGEDARPTILYYAPL